MGKQVRITNLFTGEETTYDDTEALRDGAKESCDKSMGRLIDMMVDAYADGCRTDTYEWLLGVRLSAVAEDGE